MEASCLLEYCGLFEVGVGGVVVTWAAGAFVFEFEFVEGSLDFGEEVVHCEAVSFCHFLYVLVFNFGSNDPA